MVAKCNYYKKNTKTGIFLFISYVVNLLQPLDESNEEDFSMEVYRKRSVLFPIFLAIKIQFWYEQETIWKLLFLNVRF